MGSKIMLSVGESSLARLSDRITCGGRDHLEALGIDRRTILKRTLNNGSGMMWTVNHSGHAVSRKYCSLPLEHWNRGLASHLGHRWKFCVVSMIVFSCVISDLATGRVSAQGILPKFVNSIPKPGNPEVLHHINLSCHTIIIIIIMITGRRVGTGLICLRTVCSGEVL
jgi:hypothetical protein